MRSLRPWLRQRGYGRLIYRWIYRPIQYLDYARMYGLPMVVRAAVGDTAMHRAARNLKQLPPTAGEFTVPVICLTGRRFIHQSLFCAHSFARAAGVNPLLEFLSDGNLSDENSATLLRLFPQATVRNHADLDDIVREALPPSKFPVLHAVRKNFVLLRKLTDAMAGRRGYALLFDSDMIFWREPHELLDRAGKGESLYLTDTVADGYTVSRAELGRTLGVPVAVGVNSGLVGLDSSKIDWELIERACEFLRSARGDQRLLEQTLWAIALGAANAIPLDPSTYRVVIDPTQWRRARHGKPAPVLLHYAWHARFPYTAGEWRRYLAERTA
jgi:hypothetical protein